MPLPEANTLAKPLITGEDDQTIILYRLPFSYFGQFHALGMLCVSETTHWGRKCTGQRVQQTAE